MWEDCLINFLNKFWSFKDCFLENHSGKSRVEDSSTDKSLLFTHLYFIFLFAPCGPTPWEVESVENPLHPCGDDWSQWDPWVVLVHSGGVLSWTLWFGSFVNSCLSASVWPVGILVRGVSSLKVLPWDPRLPLRRRWRLGDERRSPWGGYCGGNPSTVAEVRSVPVPLVPSSPSPHWGTGVETEVSSTKRDESKGLKTDEILCFLLCPLFALSSPRDPSGITWVFRGITEFTTILMYT